MRLHSLTIEAIGPFPGRHSIDFGELGRSGVFLLEGPTGAGKTTIIDAVVFALYGDLSGEGASDARLHSNHADPGVTPEVDLVVETGAGVFRVRRQPQHVRPKKRGSGTTTQNEKVWVWRLSAPDADVGEPVTTSTQEAGHFLKDVIGLSRVQFTQTVVLPQGQFSTFLKAKPEDRKAVLQDIFGTWLYERVQDLLGVRALEFRKRQDRLRADVAHRADAFVTAAELDDETRVPLDDAVRTHDLDSLVSGACRHVDRLAQESSRARAARDAAATAAHRATDALERERSLTRRLHQRAQLLQQQADLRARDAELDALAVRCERARAAAAVQKAVTASHRADERVATATDAVARWVEAEPVRVAWAPGDAAALSDVHASADDVQCALSDEADAARRASAALAHTEQLESGLERRAATLDAEQAALADRRTSLSRDRDTWAQRSERRAELEQERRAADRAAAGAEAARMRLAAAEQVLHAAQRVHELGEQVERQRKAETAAAREASDAEGDYLRKREVWLSGMAATLAGTLTAGEPCQVCGAVEHPEPAQLADDHVDADQVEAAESLSKNRRTAAETRRHETEQTVAELRTATDAAQGRDREGAAGMVEQATLACEAADAAATRGRTLADELTAFDADTAEQGARLETTDRDLTSAEGTLAQQRNQWESDARTIGEARGRAPSVSELRQWWEARAVRAVDGASALRGLDETRAHQTARQAERDEALAEHGFPDAGAAAAATIPPDELADGERRADQHRQQSATVAARLADPEIAELTGDEPTDVAAAEQADKAARASVEEAAGRVVEAEGRHGRAAGERDALDAARRDQATLDSEAGPVLRMAELANAGEGNATRVPLSTYVLMRRFAEVVDHANARLLVMTDGRYALRHTEEHEGGMRKQRKVGLGLEVVDHFAGDQVRDPHTLSGGETFIFSLALALGLADAVTMEAGGVDLQTLFVDEGFGTLDPEKLDLVMTELGELQAGGRLVGIVSHVEELKSQILDRVSVRRRGRGGSTLSTTTDAVSLR